MNHPFKIAAAALLAASSLPAIAQNWIPTDYKFNKVAPWMSPEVGLAWRSGYRGQRTTITVLDNFGSNNKFEGNLTGKVQTLTHGEWTSLQARLVAPKADLRVVGFNKDVSLSSSGLNVINYSAGVVLRSGLSYETASQFRPDLKTLVDAATKGSAVIAYAIGNDAVGALSPLNSGGVNLTDYTSLHLRGTKSAIYVGALSENGTVSKPASIAWYSSFPGSDAVIQKQTLVVGVDGSKNGGLIGTSFAAPIVAGYSAILGSKFKRATPTAVANQLLNTARTDTIKGYDVALHGRGEASITRALAPARIK